MKRYIEQEAVIRLIKTEGFNEKYDLGDSKDNAWFCEEVNRIPAADVVKVVRCRDCRYFYNGFMKCCTNHFGVVLTDENGFCHHAKRREDEGGNTRWVESNTYITPQQKKM